MKASAELVTFVQNWIDKSHLTLAAVEQSWSQHEGVVRIFTARTNSWPGIRRLLNITAEAVLKEPKCGYEPPRMGVDTQVRPYR